MQASTLRTGRWIVGGVVFLAAATVLFEAAGQSSPRPAPAPPNAYRAVAIDDREVRTALNFALGDQKKKNRSNNALTLLSVLSADRKSTRLNSSHSQISYAVFCLKKKKNDKLK